MYRRLCICLLVLGIACSGSGGSGTPPDLGMPGADLSMLTEDLSAPPDLSPPLDLSPPPAPRLPPPDLHPRPPGWVWSNPWPAGNDLYGIWGKDANNIWA